MSYRVCAKCDHVINNRFYQEYDCPKCGSDKMCCPIEDTRDWEDLYCNQREHEGKSTGKKVKIRKVGKDDKKD